MKFYTAFYIFLLHPIAHLSFGISCDDFAKHVLLDFVHIPPGMLQISVIKFAVENMLKFRNYYIPFDGVAAPGQPFFATVALAHIIATKVNATLTTKKKS